MIKQKHPRHWQPLQRASAGPEHKEGIAIAMAHWNVDAIEARRRLDEYEKVNEYWRNDLYQVCKRKEGDWIHLNIRRIDGAAQRDWRHFQQIKNELVGPECEAVEIYPAESRLVDTSNKFHLWCIPDPTYRFPVGFDKRDVDYTSVSTKPGFRQRSL